MNGAVARWYILDVTGEPVECDYATWLVTDLGERVVVRQDYFGHPREEHLVSTVFVGYDDVLHHGDVVVQYVGLDLRQCDGSGPFETMVFLPELPGWDGYQRRYRTRAEAYSGHMQVLDQVRVALAEREES